ncbi:hypothetical protein A6R68_01358, partial [Neotoma lepida]
MFTVIMVLLNKSVNIQVGDFDLTTIAWIFCNTSMGLPQCSTPATGLHHSCAVLNIIVSSFIFLAVLCNCFSGLYKEGIAFPPSFHKPLYPSTQKVGIANVVPMSDNNPVFCPSMASVGIRRTCIYHHNSNSINITIIVLFNIYSWTPTVSGQPPVWNICRERLRK